MLRIQFSNRIESLCDAVVTAIGAVPPSPFTTQQIVVPSTAMRRHLTLAIAERHGICANVECVYLAQWLWAQIAKVVRTVADESPFAASGLTWRLYQTLQASSWATFPRLDNYLKDPNDVMRFELSAEVAALFEQYITYRQDWMNVWVGGGVIPMPQASAAQWDDQAWQSELWRLVSAQLGAAPEHPASQFLRRLEIADAAGTDPLGLPETVHVFCLPDMPPLYLDVLNGLARWVDVTLYVLNPCREYWFDIVDPRRLRALTLRGAAGHHETGNRLLASWGKQTRAYIELLLDKSHDAPLDDAGFDDHFPDTLLGRLQHAIFTLTELEPASLAPAAIDRSIEVHVCHSLTRQLEVLQDQLLTLFTGPAPARPEEILIVTPDLEAAGPLIEAVFGNVPEERRLPFAITGRGRRTVNTAARALLALLAILPSRFPASALVGLLQQPLIGRRFDIGANELDVIEHWLNDSGIRWGLDAGHRRELGVPGDERFTLTDGLDRLFLGYALPRRVSVPTFERIAAGNAEGSQAQILGSFAEFIAQLSALRDSLREPRVADAWLEVLLALLDSFLAPAGDDLEDMAEVRETLRELHGNMSRGGLTAAVPLAVVRASLESLFDDAARGGVPGGSITFASMSSLRNLPFRFIGILGLEDGAFPSPARPREFDLMAQQPRAGDRQRRLDDRNLFLDLLLAARERLYLSYTGRSIRDNSVRPPSVVVAELLETLLPALVREPGNAQALLQARQHLIVEHPLQAFAQVYFRDGDPRLRSYNRELCEALRHAAAGPAPRTEYTVAAEDADPHGGNRGNDGGGSDSSSRSSGSGGDRGSTTGSASASDIDNDDDAPEDRPSVRFFAAPLAAPGPEWHRVSLDQLQQFFRNPCRFLLRQRLGLSLYRDEDSVTDEEPFLPDLKSRQALAERLLPQAMQGLGTRQLSRLAQAGIEYPPGALGSVALSDEMNSLQRFAAEVHDATLPSRLQPLPVQLNCMLEGEDWHLSTLLTERRETGLVLNRYDDTRAGDYLAAWLTHLAAAAASTTPIETRWISRDGSFRFTDCRDAGVILEQLLSLYRRGLREPIHFFPKSAWEYIKHGGNLAKAIAVWHRTFGDARGEDTHEAYRLALRGVANPLDAEFQACAEIVFGTARNYLDDPPPMNIAPRTPEPLDVFTCPLTGVNLIEASAGTGKTWTICGLYLRLLLEREFTVQQILVVTFTNAATAELRERIRIRILELLRFFTGPPTGTPDPFIRRLADDLLQRSEARQQDLTARLELALHSFDEAAIFTIHGFCQRALADNPFAAGLPMRTELIESDRDLLLETVHDFWRRHVAQDATPELARYLAAEKDSPEKYARLLERHLAKPLARHVWPPDLDDPPLAASWLHDSYRTARSHWLAHKADVRARVTAALDQLHGGTYKPASLDEAAAHWDLLCRDDDPLAVIGGKAKLFRLSVLAEKTKKKCTTPTHAFFAHAEAYLSLREALEHSQFLARCRLLRRLFGEASAQLQTLKRSRQVVAFNDMLANVHERLQHPDYPWLAASIRLRFPAALIDEFQDTDPLQLAIFKKIYDTADSPVFLVGDPKQAIYGFRHADLHSYLRATRWADRQWSLTDNQRSSRSLLTGLNALFGANGGAFVLPEVRYRTLGYGTKPRAPFVDSSEARAPLQVWRLPDAGGALPKPRARRAAVDATAAEIARLLQAALDGRITLEGRALRPGDIAVLVRSRSLGADVKRALALLDVGAVELSRDSIFGSPDARDWETVLTAIASPTRDGLLRAALATEIFGQDAPELERIAASDTRLPGWILEFMEYRELWVNRGFGVMVRQVFADQGVARRLLARPDGERRLTNCLHVTEELQKAAESHSSPEALLRWFKAAQDGTDNSDAAQLRLESDQNLVQIVTIHACKGLEYPIVFCPFLCDGSTKFGAPGPEGYEYHDPELQPVIDFNDYTDDTTALLPIKAQIKLEQAAETVRLLYVALTRAVHRCYLVMGPYDMPRDKNEAGRSMLNWLVAGDGSAPADWFDSRPTTAQLDAAWAGVAAAGGGSLVIDTLPMRRGLPLRPATFDADTLTTPAPPGSMPTGWRMSSYSGLSYGARSESAAGDHDARTVATLSTAGRPADLAPDDILRFPRGAAAGECIHAVFEHIDFADRSGWEGAIHAALANHPQSRADDPKPLPAASLARMLRQLVEHVTTATLIPGLQLMSVPRSRRLTELEFNLPVPHLSAAALNAALKAWGYDVPTVNFGALEGYLKGFIDLVFEHQGRYFILDWKSNHLGYTAADYGGGPLERAMAEHGYHLQYLLYAIALDRYLELRVPDYGYDTHFGGVLYLFVRGIRPSPLTPGHQTIQLATPGDAESRHAALEQATLDQATQDQTALNQAARDHTVPDHTTPDHPSPGVFFHRPNSGILRALNDLLGSRLPGSTRATVTA